MLGRQAGAGVPLTVKRHHIGDSPAPSRAEQKLVRPRPVGAELLGSRSSNRGLRPLLGELTAILGREPAILGRVRALVRSLRANLAGRGSVDRGLPAVVRRAQQPLHASLPSRDSVSRQQRIVTERGGPIARQ
jgi:hypothetical protein